MKWVFLLGLCITLIGFHICAIIQLSKKGQLSKNRFFLLSLILIISDSLLTIEFAWFLIVRLTVDFSTNGSYQYQCLVLIHLAPAMIHCSLLMTLFLCLQRLNATFRAPTRILKMFTSNIAVGLGLLLIHVYVLCHFVWELKRTKTQGEPYPCELQYYSQPTFAIFMEVPNLVFVTLIWSCYAFVILRMYKSQQKTDGIEGLSEFQIKQKRKATLRMRYNFITLGCIIFVTACSMLPRTLNGMYSYISETENSDVIKTTNELLLLSPLVDPFVYIFRVKKIHPRLIYNCFKSNTIAPYSKEVQPRITDEMRND